MRTYTKLAHDLKPGCYVDGDRGWRAISHMVEQFNGVAYDLDEDDRAMIDRYENDDCSGDDAPFEAVQELAEECEDMLNDLLPGSLLAHWHDGEFFISPYCGDPETPCDDEACYCHIV